MTYSDNQQNAKKISGWIFLFGLPMMLLLCGCPYQSRFQLDDSPQIPVDDRYLGDWEGAAVDEIYHRSTPVHVSIHKKNDLEYDLMICGEFTKQIPGKKKYKKWKATTDTILATGFVSYAEGKEFLNISVHDNIYISQIVYKDERLSLLPLSEHFTSFIVHSNTELRKRLEYHFHTRLYPAYDESFCLKNMKRK